MCHKTQSKDDSCIEMYGRNQSMGVFAVAEIENANKIPFVRFSLINGAEQFSQIAE